MWPLSPREGVGNKALVTKKTFFAASLTQDYLHFLISDWSGGRRRKKNSKRNVR